MIVVIDYGVGNVGSILNMLRKIGAKARLGSTPEDMKSADKLILPGIGHFGHGMKKLRETGLVPAIEEHALSARKPLLGICLGMQMMTRGSEESDMQGLGWIDATTLRFPDNTILPIPHMGWNAVTPRGKAQLFEHDAGESQRFYFVHSYYVSTDRPEDVAAVCEYGFDFTAAFEVGNLFGAQFHPEKSHLFGMSMLRKFDAL